MLDKPKHEASGMDPYTYAKAEKRAKMEKHKLSELKNKIHASNTNQKKDIQLLGAASSVGEKSSSSLKLKEDAQRT